MEAKDKIKLFIVIFVILCIAFLSFFDDNLTESQYFILGGVVLIVLGGLGLLFDGFLFRIPIVSAFAYNKRVNRVALNIIAILIGLSTVIWGLYFVK